MTISTTKIALTSTDWTDLGAGPLEIQTSGAPAILAFADAKPAAADAGFSITFGTPLTLQTTSHVWARSAGDATMTGTVTTAPVSSSGGSGGGATTLGPGENHAGEIGGNSAVVTAAFTRAANTTPYSTGQIVANSMVAGSVTPMTLAVARKTGGTGRISRARLTKTSTVVTNAAFRAHLYRALPATISNGDGGSWLTNESTYVGSLDVTIDKVFTDGAKGIGLPTTGAFLTFDTIAGSQNLYALLEARAAYTPASAETFTLALEVDRD